MKGTYCIYTLLTLAGVANFFQSSEVLLKLRERLVDREQELSETKKKLSDVEAKLAITEKELVTAKSDCMPHFLLTVSCCFSRRKPSR